MPILLSFCLFHNVAGFSLLRNNYMFVGGVVWVGFVLAWVCWMVFWFLGLLFCFGKQALC